MNIMHLYNITQISIIGLNSVRLKMAVSYNLSWGQQLVHFSSVKVVSNFQLHRPSFYLLSPQCTTIIIAIPPFANGYWIHVLCIPANDVFIQPWFLMTQSLSAGQEQYSLPISPYQQQVYFYILQYKKGISTFYNIKREFFSLEINWDFWNICGVKNGKVFDPALVCKQSTFCLLLSSSVCFLSYTTRWTRWRNVFITMLPRGDD